MKTKKEYMAPTSEQIELDMKFAVLAGSTTDAAVDPSGEDWTND